MTKLRRTILPSSIFLALAFAAAPALAEGGAEDAAAVAVFQDGRKLAVAGDFAGACRKFQEVKRTLPTAGLSLNLGDCLEHTNRLASAWAEFKAAERVAQSTHDADRQAEGLRRALAIEGRLSKLTITVAESERLPGLTVTRDGVDVGEGQWGTAVPVDGGEHVVEVSAPGHRSWTTKVSIAPERATASVAVPRLVPEEPKIARVAGEIQGADTGGSGGSTQRLASFATLGVGAAGLVVGAITLGLDAAKHASLASQCSGGICMPSLQGDVDTYHSLSVAWTTSFGIGGALAVTGTILLVTAPKAQPRALGLVPLVGPGFVGVGGRFQ